MYKKIFKNMCILSVIILVLTVLVTLSASYSVFIDKLSVEYRDEIVLILINILAFVFFFSALIYVLSLVIAVRLTDNVVKPITDIHLFNEIDAESVYEEIMPILSRIKHQKKEIQRLVQKNESQKFRLNAVTNNMNEGLIIIGENKNIISLNNCTIDLFNVNEYNYRQKKFNEITDNEALLDAANKALSGTRNDIITSISSKIYQVFSSPVYEAKKISGVIMLLFDISAKAETELIRREFSANVSHELKTPLTSIHGFAQIITSGIAKDEDIKGFAKKIEKESSRLINLIEDIIKLSKLDENDSGNDKDNFYLKSVVDDVCEMLNENAKEKNIHINITGTDTLIYANLSQITEMLYNLFDNAIKYNKQDGLITINISEKQISVTDTGIGIPESDIDRIFERFFRVDKSHSKKVNGTGLGLSIVKHIAKANNATITVFSKINEGTTFTVEFQQ